MYKWHDLDEEFSLGLVCICSYEIEYNQNTLASFGEFIQCFVFVLILMIFVNFFSKLKILLYIAIYTTCGNSAQ